MDDVEKAKSDFAYFYSQIVWLAERLSEARILVNQDSCANCRRMSFEACKLCWCQAAASAVRKGRHSR